MATVALVRQQAGGEPMHPTIWRWVCQRGGRHAARAYGLSFGCLVDFEARAPRYGKLRGDVEVSDLIVERVGNDGLSSEKQGGGNGPSHRYSVQCPSRHPTAFDIWLLYGRPDASPHARLGSQAAPRDGFPASGVHLTQCPNDSPHREVPAVRTHLGMRVWVGRARQPAPENAARDRRSDPNSRAPTPSPPPSARRRRSAPPPPAGRSGRPRRRGRLPC